jgi:hypothetical protein
MSQQSQILGALRVGLVALCAMAVYGTTKQIRFPRMSLVQSHIIAIFFEGWVGLCISFIIRQLAVNSAVKKVAAISIVVFVPSLSSSAS